MPLLHVFFSLHLRYVSCPLICQILSSLQEDSKESQPSYSTFKKHATSTIPKALGCSLVLLNYYYYLIYLTLDNMGDNDTPSLYTRGCLHCHLFCDIAMFYYNIVIRYLAAHSDNV